ncbi:PepSY-associated TM helix domain-containing protein [Aquimarina sp. 2201CG5-10]|uniref:PepSY-associated TM helix domain-containing protein n=1 Tax=Aquimarina callyspongiae TaxID=3098150 RepID=UPI002AB43DFD|nr:PepSY-associated TM helix domain-containing protein [Aquimarina sp. 2201CG5-10]MDY8135946.1 PepSY-associated TM helix domain-containing protein [Aquimarina sp. 2201CG5-10]
MIKKKKKNTRKTILELHKILGLTTGLVVFVVSITGCLWVFKDEIESFYDDHKYVVPQEQSFLPPSKIKTFAEQVIPNRSIHGVIYGKPNEAIEVVFYEAEPEIFYQSVFLNPYTGGFITRIDNNAGFFGFVLKGHLRLWLPDAIGSRIVSYSILLFLILLISGLILWWPRNNKNWKQRLKFDWNSKTRWKRKNFDLHTVVGFYISAFALILTFTGCVMAFNWFYFIAFKVAGGDKAPQFIVPQSIVTATIEDDPNPAYDQLIPLLYETYKEAENFELHYPENDSTSVLVEVSNSQGVYYNMDYLFFDQYSLKEIETSSIYGKYKNADFADKVIRMNYDIHVGAIGGIIGKIIAFLASFVCASLPVSGILLWYGRTYKKKKNKKKAILPQKKVLVNQY